MTGTGEPEPRNTPWRDNVEALAIAVIVALTLKYFVLEAYKIPTGSMQPTLMGNPLPETGIHDRILVDKLAYHFRDPRRWEVIVFRYPLDRSKNFVKRLVGMPGEELKIQHGDLWRRDDANAEWEVLRRPRPVQREVWKKLDRDEPTTSSWRVTADGVDWTLEGRAIAARGTGTARFGEGTGSIMDEYWHGYPDGMVPDWDEYPGGLNGKLSRKSRNGAGGDNAVGDLRLEGEVRALAGCVAVEVLLEEGSHPARFASTTDDLRKRQYTFRIPGPAAEPDARPELRVVERVQGREARLVETVQAEPYRLPAGAAVRFGAQNMDDRVALDLAGEVVASLDVAAAGSREQRSAIHLTVEGEGADFAELMPFRDIYYLQGGQSNVTIPEGSYYVLGDNTQDSSDSREWRRIRYELEGADGEPRQLEGGRDDENPVRYLGGEDGSELWLRDLWGETQRFLANDPDVTRLSPVDTPFVPREMILGRALAVFWPFSIRHGVYRLKWVH